MFVATLVIFYWCGSQIIVAKITMTIKMKKFLYKF